MSSSSTMEATARADDGYRLVTVQDQWSEMLPPRVPLRFSFFRYLGFCVKQTKNGKESVVKSRRIGGLRVTIKNEQKVIFSDKISSSFKNGVFYVQDIRLDTIGLYSFTIVVDGPLSASVAPLVLETHVHEFMQLNECADLLARGPYVPLRQFVEKCCGEGDEQKLRNDKVVDSFVRSKAHKLRVIDAKWWLRTFVEHTLDREERRKALQKKSVIARSSHKRKQEHPARCGDQREHTHFFEGRRREWKRMRNGELRMFVAEPLYANATLTLYSTGEMYRQLTMYAQM